MKILVTGGSGKLGRYVVRDLVEHGHEVTNLDAVPPPTGFGEGARFLRVDVTDHGQMLEAVLGVDEHRAADGSSGVDALVHLAAIPAPGLRTDHQAFMINIGSTHSAFAAARAARVHTVVWASSETVLGLPFAPGTPPPYAPVDEEYSPRPASSYSLSKDLGEEMARQFCRWDPELVVTGLRFSNVMEPADYEPYPGWQDDPGVRAWNLWGYIDARDGAQAVRRALERSTPGAEVCIIAAADTTMERDSADLLSEVFPHVEVRGTVTGRQTLLGIEKARSLLGYEPEHSWRDHVVSS